MAASVMCGGLAMAGEPVVRVETGAARAGITAWDYVEASGDLAWPGRNIGKPSGSRRVVDEEYLRTRFEWSACHLFAEEASTLTGAVTPPPTSGRHTITSRGWCMTRSGCVLCNVVYS